MSTNPTEARIAGCSIVGTQRGEAETGRPTGAHTFRAVDPTSGNPLEPAFTAATAAEVDRATRLAADAFEPFASSDGAARADFLERIAANLEARRDGLVARATRETALAEARLTGEVGRTTGQLRLFADLVRDDAWRDARIDPGDPRRAPAPKPDLRSMRRAIGPVAVFGASNFPFAFSVAGGDTAAALAAGCPVVVKAHPGHPGTSELVGTAIADAARASDLPEGVFSLLFDDGHDVGVQLVKAPEIRAVGFTGSRTGGEALMRIAAERPVPIPVYAEMGSLNPVFVTAGAMAIRAEDTAAGFVASLTLGAGQFCTKPGLVFVPDGDDGRRFARTVAEVVTDSEAGRLLNAGILAGLQARLTRTWSLPGVEVLATGRAPDAAGFGCATTVLSTDLATFRATPELAEEHFGPVALVVRCPGVAGLEAAADALAGSLTASLHAQPDELPALAGLQGRLQARCGRLIFDQFPTGVAVTAAMHHGGPYPATTDPAHTSVGTAAIDRFLRPVSYQNAPAVTLPPPLREDNPWGLPRLVDGQRREA